ncbi:hypothetical protein EDC04DRAFT_2740927 [Pisolithus marmoratus]|nr:hypothetical protein EDC04DRAFT_2740927 [Pisolithus marmoratus]
MLITPFPSVTAALLVFQTLYGLPTPEFKKTRCLPVILCGPNSVISLYTLIRLYEITTFCHHPHVHLSSPNTPLYRRPERSN